MANGTEAIGRLLYNSAMLQGERNLTLKRDAPSAPQAPAQVIAPPLAHDGRATAAVLMTLLEDQLDAADANLANASRNGEAKAAAQPGSGDASRQVAQRYAENGFVATSGDDGVRQDMTGVADHARLPGVAPPVSGDLASFIQRSAAIAAVQPDRLGVEPRARTGAFLAYINGLSALKLAGVAAGTLWLALLMAGWLLS